MLCKAGRMRKKNTIKKTLSSGKTPLKNRLSVRKDASRPFRQGAVDALLFSDEESFFRAITSNTPDHILMQDLELRYLLVVNPQLGLTEKDMIGKTDHDILSKDDADNITKIKKQVIETDTPMHFEAPLIDRDGKRQFFDGSYVPKHDAIGRVDGLIGYFRNVTDRKLAEEALQESENRYRDLFNSLIEGYCIVEMVFDSDGKPLDYRFLEVNEAFESQTGLHEARGKLMRDLAPDHEQYWFDIYGKIAMTGEPAHFVNEAMALDRWFDVQAFRVGLPESRRVAICFSDITERKKAEDEVWRNAEELRASNEELARFNRAMVGRELRMVELKKQVNELCSKLGEPRRFKMDTDGNE